MHWNSSCIEQIYLLNDLKIFFFHFSIINLFPGKSLFRIYQTVFNICINILYRIYFMIYTYILYICIHIDEHVSWYTFVYISRRVLAQQRRQTMVNIYGLTNSKASSLSYLNDSWLNCTVNSRVRKPYIYIIPIENYFVYV